MIYLLIIKEVILDHEKKGDKQKERDKQVEWHDKKEKKDHRKEDIIYIIFSIYFLIL